MLGYGSLHCLSAMGPMRTIPPGFHLGTKEVQSPVPFGGGSHADKAALKRAKREIGGAPEPFGGGSYADRQLKEGTIGEDLKSPVPFGGGSYADVPGMVGVYASNGGLQCLSAVGPMRTENSKRQQRILRVGLQCLSAVGPMRTS